jgi:DNA-binding NarL/FixJ family response regulator
MSPTDLQPIGVLIVDDHRMFAESLARLLSDEADLDVLGIAGSGKEAVALVAALHPQVVLVDYQMPDQDGVSVTADLKRLDAGIHVIMLTAGVDDRSMIAAIEAGCSGFLTKDRASSEVATAVRAVSAGEALITPLLLARLLPKLKKSHRELGSDLTGREREVLTLLSTGLNANSIALELYLSINTVRKHVQSILLKLHTHSQLEAVSAAVRSGIIRFPDYT